MPSLLVQVLAALVVALQIYAAARAILRKSGVSSTLAWILAIITFPVVGAAAYLMFASPSIRRAARRQRPTARGLFGGRPLAPAALPEGIAEQVVTLAARLTGLPPTSGNRVELLTSSRNAFQTIEQAVRGATRRIWAEYYIIKNDATGRRFLDLLAEKAAEGVEVRLLYDAVGSLRIDPARLRAIEAAGGHCAVFLPVNPFRRRWSTHLRNHRKLVLVDDALGFTGGMNVGDEYSGRARRRGGVHFHDSHLAIRGPAVADLAEIFVEDWTFATETALDVPRAPPAAGESVTAIVPSGPDQVHNAHGMVYFAAIAAARRSVWIASPYFVPDGSMVQALVAAALRGVDVRLLVPARNDIRLVGWAARSYYPELIGAGVRVWEYLPSMLHAKRMVVDESFGIVGSANVDIRSFRLNFELGALIADRAVAADLTRQFHVELRDSREVTSAQLLQSGLGVRLRDGIARLFSPLL
ncbi:MAG: cardiolipin synthase [Myxococcales bacterium]|nr:cardiolipin synthase [Myxococcales bacterium]